MKRDDVIDYTRRVFKCTADNALETAEHPRSYPASMFTDREYLDVERRRLFADTPHVVGFIGQVNRPGAYFTCDVAGVPVLVVRGHDGELRAFLNSCSHRGASVAQGAGCSRRFTCGYHSWSYDSSGRLASLPGKSMFAGMDLDGLGLTPLPVSVEAGLIVVGLHRDVTTAGALGSLNEALSEERFGDVVPIAETTVRVAANWKLAVDINFEGYHFPVVHTDSLNPMVTNHSPFDLFGRHSRWAFPMRTIDELAGQAEADWPADFLGTVVFFLYPSCVLVDAFGTQQLIRIYPGTHPGESIMNIAYTTTLNPTEEDKANHRASFEFVKNLLLQEDVPMAEQCQRGLDGGRERIVVGRNEPLLQHLHDAWIAGIS